MASQRQTRKEPAIMASFDSNENRIAKTEWGQLCQLITSLGLEGLTKELVEALNKNPEARAAMVKAAKELLAEPTWGESGFYTPTESLERITSRVLPSVSVSRPTKQLGPRCTKSGCLWVMVVGVTRNEFDVIHLHDSSWVNVNPEVQVRRRRRGMIEHRRLNTI